MTKTHKSNLCKSCPNLASGCPFVKKDSLCTSAERYNEGWNDCIDKACEYLYNNQPTIGDSMREYIDNFRKAMTE